MMYPHYTLLGKLFMAKISGESPVFGVFMKGKKVLDVGCGEGSLLKINPEMVYGVDINKTVLEKLQAQGLRAKYSDATSLDFDDNFFDVVHCSNIIEHLTPVEAHKMFEEMSRVLAPGGKILLITPLPSTVWNTFGHIKPYPPQAIKKLFREVSLESFNSIRGLEIESIFYFGKWGSRRSLALLAGIIANVTPFLRGSYFMVIKKGSTS